MDITQIIIAAIPPFFNFITIVFTGFITYMTIKINHKMHDAKKVNDSIHTLVNSNMGLQLKIAMGLAAKVADLTNKKKDMNDATETKRLYDDHMRKQAVVDDKNE